MADLILVSEAAEVMGVSYRSAKRSLQDAGIPFERVRYAPAISQADFALFMAARARYSGRGRVPASIKFDTETSEDPPSIAEWIILRKEIEALALSSEKPVYKLMKAFISAAYVHDLGIWAGTSTTSNADEKDTRDKDLEVIEEH